MRESAWITVGVLGAFLGISAAAYALEMTPLPIINPIVNPNAIINPSPIPGGGIIGGLPIIGGNTNNDLLGDLDRIVNLGTKVWSLIQQNKATSDFMTASANAIPMGLTAWDQTGGWRAAGGKNYQLPILDSKGKSVYNWDARVSFEFGGNVDGKGAFLRNVTVQASDVQVSWAHNFNAKVTIPDSSISNYGDKDSPDAQMEVEIDYSYDTSVFVHRDSSVLLLVRGDGSIEDISADDSAPTQLYPIGRGNNTNK